MIQSARRIENYHYAIRHLAGAADVLIRAGREVIYLNIGDPQVYGFRPPEHIVEPVISALRSNFNESDHRRGGTPGPSASYSVGPDSRLRQHFAHGFGRRAPPVAWVLFRPARLG